MHLLAAPSGHWATPAACSCLCAAPSGVTGVLTVETRRDGRPYNDADGRLLASLANLVALFLERQRLQSTATQAEASREADRLKSSLLSSVSHELKTAAAALTATVSNLLESVTSPGTSAAYATSCAPSSPTSPA